MTDTPEKDTPEDSPDILSGPPKRGIGVRRLNKRPLMIAMGSASVIALVLVFTLNAKAHRPEADPMAGGVSAAPNGGAVAARPEFMRDAPTAGLIEADGSEAWGQDGVPLLMAEAPNGALTPAGGGNVAQPTLTQANYTGAPQGGAYNPHAQAWETYHQRRADQRQSQNERAQNATGADSAVQLPSRNDAAGSPTAASASMGGPGAGQMMMQGGNPAAGGQGGGRGGGGDLNRQDDKRAFLTESGGRDPYAAGRVERPVSALEVKAGTVIPATLITGVNSDLPGQLVAQVNRNVYDTATGRRLLIPQGARLIGTYDSSVTTGQSRVLVAWTRLIYPDGSSIDLGSMPGADAGGYSGLTDRVNNRYMRTFGNAIFLSMFAAGVQLSQPQAAVGERETASQVATAQLGQQLGQLGMETARRQMQVQPNLQIRPGYNLTVSVTQDLILREWQPRRGPVHN